MKLGDVFAKVAQPTARSLDSLLGTNIEGCSGCKDRQERLNNFGDKLFDSFWSSKIKKEQNMDDTSQTEEKVEYQVVVAITATDIREALDKFANGKVISITPRPIRGPLIPQRQ